MESSNPTTSFTKSNHAATDFVTPSVAKIELHPSGKRHLSPSSSINSSPDSPLDDPFKSDDDDGDDDKFISGSESSSPSHERGRSPTRTSNPSPSVHRRDEATEPPCNQTMERVASKYRIPSSVFARSKHDAPPVDWSAASNESLFSIHGANMSFKNDRYMFRQSGELGGPAEEASTSDHMFSYSAQHPKCGEMMRSRELGLAEATMKEVIRESESHQHYVTSLAAESRGSGSGTSTKSFAFSTKEGDSRKSVQSKLPPSVKPITDEPMQCQPQPPLTDADITVQPSRKHDPKPNFGRPKWASCFAWCSLC